MSGVAGCRGRRGAPLWVQPESARAGRPLVQFAKDQRQRIGRREWWCEGIITEGDLYMYEEPLLGGGMGMQ